MTYWIIILLVIIGAANRAQVDSLYWGRTGGSFFRVLLCSIKHWHHGHPVVLVDEQGRIAECPKCGGRWVHAY